MSKNNNLQIVKQDANYEGKGSNLTILSYDKIIIYAFKNEITLNYTLINSKKHNSNYQKAVLEVLDDGSIAIYNKLRELKTCNNNNNILIWQQYRDIHYAKFINYCENKTNDKITSTWARFTAQHSTAQ